MTLASKVTAVLQEDEILPQLVIEHPGLSVCVWCCCLGVVECTAGLWAVGPTAPAVLRVK